MALDQLQRGDAIIHFAQPVLQFFHARHYGLHGGVSESSDEEFHRVTICLRPQPEAMHLVMGGARHCGRCSPHEQRLRQGNKIRPLTLVSALLKQALRPVVQYVPFAPTLQLFGKSFLGVLSHFAYLLHGRRAPGDTSTVQ